MTAIAVGLVLAVLTATEVGSACSFRNEGDRCHIGLMVAAITKRLFIATPAGAPVVVFAFFQFNGERCLLCDYRFVTHSAHLSTTIKINYIHIRFNPMRIF